ncbi:xylulokinase [Larsenimonas suaedae]|uniref:Xylulose kinase n=1 Tax=Larsenimonas suaedae TaxID=1851019 RepID=A0ABU1GSF0_9GAMM|nr:xylulokinase [Larsenimonas suaedae]MCM2972258.1 xylulokinase [Larsenimonas suaedae]MDR5894946.1 xylulokinase [Larsenimonas suaedae]
MYLGVDCGTQSTKVVVFDSGAGRVIGEGRGAHRLISEAGGRREQDPAWWVEAFEHALAQALSNANIDGRAIRAMGVSGQQHGMVALDKAGVPVYPAKLWNDTEAYRECEALIEQLGGEQGCLDRLGIIPQPGYTAPKLAWLRAHHPDAYRRIDCVLLPHDYLNFYLTGERTAEFGDASGTGYFDTRTREWATDVFERLAPELDAGHVLPRLIEACSPVGRLRPDLAARLGLEPSVLVSSGGGDNMMGAIGTGNITPGALTMSLGTSGTVYGCSDAPVITDNGLAANFCSSHGNWLPLICTMNVTSATEQVRALLGCSLEDFGAALERSPIGAQGVQVLPFFNGERVPRLPDATASFLGLSSNNTTGDNLCRAVMEGATFGLRYGLDLLSAQGLEPSGIRLVGGGAKSPQWRQMVADVMNAPVICPRIGEAAAFGAALQAQWCHLNDQGEPVALSDLCAKAVSLDEAASAAPVRERVEAYEVAYRRYLATLRAQGMI